MEFSVEAGLFTIKFNLVFSLALAAAALFAGYFVQRRVGVLSRANIPAAAVGGLLFAGLVFALRAGGVSGLTLDTSLRAPLQTAFFTTIGLGATTALLRAGGWRMGFFWLLATLTAVVQNVVGMALAVALGAPALLGVICGALTLTGGPATGLAWAERFKSLGISGADSLIAASAMFGIFTASLVGNPVATALIRRRRLAPQVEEREEPESEFWALSPTIAPDEGNEGGRSTVDEGVAVGSDDELSAGVLLHNLLLVLVVMGVGVVVGLLITSGVNALLGMFFGGSGFVLPDYIGAMIVAAVVRNVDDRTGWFRLHSRAVELIAGVALALFLVVALMNIKLWEIAGLALPMTVILCAQVLLMAAYAVLVTFPLMGRDYEAAVTAGGHIGFGLGTTANAVANMEALVERFAPAPRSFLVVPIVGAFFIDFSNALVIFLFTGFAR
ncbi:MAG TPA: sodium/glutamate symporter [Pyrinomonadaceae bacterium]|nr:sodium/glutamate symporter [Pyrinomonadaceae bacterium]